MMAPNANVRQVVQGTEQVLPTWLTYSPIVGPSGTSYTILRLPLTYYGPSIPLGTDGTWTYGGLSSPPPSATASMTPTSTPPPVTTVPPTSTFSSTTLPTSTSLTSTRPTTTTFASVSVITRSRTSTASTATGTPTAAPGGSPLPPIAIALIALGAAAAVLLCCLIGALLWRRRKSRRDREPLRGDSEFYAGPGPDEDIESIHAVPNLTGERHSLLGNDSFIVVPGSSRSPQMTQRSFNGVSYQRLGESRAPSHHSSRRTGSTEIGVAYTDMPPPRSRRRTVTVVSNAVSSSPSHPTSSSRPGIGSMRSRNESQRSSLFERPAEQDESPVLPRESTNGMIRRASDIGPRLLQAPAPAAQPLGFPFGPGATLGTELGMLGLGTRYPDPSQSLLATSSSGGSYPAPRLVVPTPSSLGSRSRQGPELSRPTSQFVTGSQSGSRNSRVSRGHSPAPSIPPSPPPRDTMTWPDSPESEHDESAQLLTAERGNVRSGIGLLGRFSWFTRGNGSPARTSRNSYPGWMSPPTEEGFLAEADAEAGPSTYDPPTLESKPPTSHPGMVRLVPREQRDPTPPRPISSVSGGTVYHDAPSQPATPRTPVSTWLGFLGRASPASGPAPPVPQRPTPLSQTPTSTPAPVPSTTVTPPPPVRTRGSSDSEIDPASRLPREQQAPPQSRPHSDILDAPAPESLLDVASPVLVPPSPAPVFPPGLTRLPRTWNFGLLNELGDEPPAAEERWAHIRSTPSLSWDLRRFSLGRSVQVNSPHTVTDSQVASVHGGGTASPTTSDPRPGPISHSSSRSLGSQAQRAGGSSENSRRTDSDTRRAPAADPDQPGGTTRHSVSLSGTGTSADTTTVSSNHPSTLMMTESGRFGFDFGGYGYVDSEYDDYETRATTISSNISGDSSGREAVDLHGEDMEGGQEVYVREGGRFMPPMSAVGISNWGQHADADPGRA